MQWVLRFRVCIIICLAVVLISTAVIFSVLRAALPHATGYKNEIQQEVSKQIGLPVEIESIDAAIHGFSPRLKLIGVSVYDEKHKVPLFNFREAFVELDVIASVLRREIIIDEIGLIGADISIEKMTENEWLVQGISISSEGSSELPDQFMYMLQNADYLLHDSNIYYKDHTDDKLYLDLLDVNIDVENSFNNHDIIFSMNLPELYGSNLVVVANLSGDIDSLDGDIYIEANQANIKQWDKKFGLTDAFNLDAVLDINLWLTLDNNNIQSMVAQFDAENFLIKNTATLKKWNTDFLSSNIRFVREGDNWNIAISDFYFGFQEQPQWNEAVTLTASNDDHNYYLSSSFFRYRDILKISEVFLDEVALARLDDLKAYKIEADVYNLNLKLPIEISQQHVLEGLYVDATVVDLAMSDSENGINLTGLDASLHVDDEQIIVDINSQDVNIALLNLLRKPLSVAEMQGSISFEHDGSDWLVSSEQLQIKNNHINIFTRLNAKVSDADKVFIDMQSDMYDGYGKYAKHYLPVGVMSPELIDWLDMAVIDGYIPNGKFILHGDVADFPFIDNNGAFQVLFDAQDAELIFLENWPTITEMSATLKFRNQSLYVTGAKGKTQGINLLDGYAEILNLDKPHLTVITGAQGKNVDVQSYVWNSALDEILGDSLRLFQIEGDNTLSLTLNVPIDDEEIQVAIDGHLDFSDTTIHYMALDYSVSDINGIVDFTQDSVFANDMQAKIKGETVSINAYTRDGPSGSEAVFHLDGRFGADYLLHQYDWIPQHWVSGKSDWSVDIEVPYETGDYLAHVQARSSLENVKLHLSDAVSKSAGKKLFLTADIDVLDNNGLHVSTKFSTNATRDTKDKTDKALLADVIDIYAVRDESFLWRFDIDSKYMQGKGEFTEGLSRDTQIKLNLDKIDTYSLFHTSNSSGGGLNPGDFPPLKFNFKKVVHDKWKFKKVVLETGWHKHGMMINKLYLIGPKMVFDARGTWLTSWRGAHETVLEGKIKSSNLGKTLAGLGFEKSINRTEYEATFDSKWPAEPYELSWANMEGKTIFEMDKGEIVDVDPGTGARLLGLLNIFKLTNRLVFDFDDVTREGFAFDTIDGEFEFVNGNGYLKKFDVSAPAADINLFGSVGLVNRDYELLMRVKPHTDTLTFAGGALLGGVAIGAGLAIIQKIFDLGVIGHNVYSITGSWDNPQVEKIVDHDEDDNENIDEDDDDF